MKCPFCQEPIDKNDLFCDHCGSKLPQKKSPAVWVVIIIILLIAILLAYFVIQEQTKPAEVQETHYIKCASKIGSITIYYNATELTGYETSNYAYDFDQEQTNVKDTGLNTYLSTFEQIFKIMNNGVCAYDEEPDTSLIPEEISIVWSYESNGIQVSITSDKKVKITGLETCEADTCTSPVTEKTLNEENYNTLVSIKEIVTEEYPDILKQITDVLTDENLEETSTELQTILEMLKSKED